MKESCETCKHRFVRGVPRFKGQYMAAVKVKVKYDNDGELIELGFLKRMDWDNTWTVDGKSLFDYLKILNEDKCTPYKVCSMNVVGYYKNSYSVNEELVHANPIM